MVVGTGLGLVYAALVRVSLPASGYQPGRREWLTGIALGVAMTIVGVVLFWNEIGQNFLGLPLDWARTVTGLSLLTVPNGATGYPKVVVQMR